MDYAFSLLLTYKYFILIPLAVVEGPIITVIAGFLITLGYMNIFLVYLIVIIGDLAGDTFFYSLGRWGKNFVYEYGHYIGINTEKLEKAKKSFTNKETKTIILSKLFHGIGVVGLVATGILDFPYLKYIKISTPISIIQTTVFIFIGIIFGHSYLKIAQYFDLYASTISIVVIILFILTIIYKVFNLKFLWKQKSK